MSTSILVRAFLPGLAGLALAAGLLFGGPGLAADYSYRVVGGKLVVEVGGRINEDELQAFAAWKERVILADGSIFAAMPIAALVLNSGGGSVTGALDLAAYVRAERLDTGVPAGGTCSSSCFTVWAAGWHRSVAPDARIGVHAVTSVSLQQSGQSTTTTIVGDINTSGNARVAAALAAYGTPDRIIRSMAGTPPSDMYWFNSGDYAAMNATVAW
jgi:hypothetical protein